MKKGKLINQLISRPNTPINTPTQNQYTNCELERIDKQAVDDIAKLICTYPQCIHYNIIGECANAECQTVDIAQNLYKAGYRKQSEGEWVDEPHFAQRGLKGKYYVCSKCNVCVPTIEELPLHMWHYCPNCGAHMKGGEG